MLTKPPFWLLMQYLPPQAHVLPLILRPTYPGRPLSPQLPALPRVMTANSAQHRRDALRSGTAQEFSTYPDHDRPTVSHFSTSSIQPLPRRRIRRHGRLPERSHP